MDRFICTVNWGNFGHPPLVTVTPQCSNGGWPKLPQFTVAIFPCQQKDRRSIAGVIKDKDTVTVTVK